MASMAKAKTAFVCNDCGADYGKWCAAWEDGWVTAGTADVVKGYNNGSHTGGGSLGAMCHEHWPTYDYAQHQVLQ